MTSRDRSPEPAASDHDDHLGIDLEASWNRSSRLGVCETSPSPRSAPDADPRGRLTTVAAPVLDRLAATIESTGASVVLTDASAAVVDRRVGPSRLRRFLDDVGLIPGWSFAEDAVGTNGMGTAAEERRPVVVNGDDHYAHPLHRFSCVGVPIEHPITGRLEGVLDLTSFVRDAGAWMTPLAVEAVAGIRSELEAASSAAERALFNAFLRATGRAAGPIVSLGESLVLTNPAAARLLDGVDAGSLRELGADVVGRGADVVHELILGGGESIRARFEVVEVGTRAVGAIVRLDEASVPRTRSIARRPSASDDLTEWASRIRAGVRAGERVLVRGGPGTGKVTAVDEALTGTDLGPIDRFDAARLVIDGTGPWLKAIEVSPAPVIVVQHLDLLDDHPARALGVVLDDAAGRAVIATTGPDGLSQALADRFDRIVELPDLAERRSELAEIVRGLLARIAPRGTVRLAPEVLQAFGRVDWPGNLRQLEAVLRRIVGERPTGTVTMDDLPADIRADAHRPNLTTMERHECDAIAAALADADGNKLAAAKALGISRSTLYRKIDAYGLDLERRTY